MWQKKDKIPNSVFSVFVCLLIFVWIPSALKITRMAFGDTDVDVSTANPLPLQIEESKVIRGWKMEYTYKKIKKAAVGWNKGGGGVG